jgi:hypothetical protein
VTFEECIKCEYTGGFHIVLVQTPPTKEVRQPASVVLKCPNCGQTYEVGWVIDLQLK